MLTCPIDCGTTSATFGQQKHITFLLVMLIQACQRTETTQREPPNVYNGVNIFHTLIAEFYFL